jgi:AcrR family transcriptional regulator
MFAQEGVAAVSMRRIAAAVGCSPMALYRYFGSKDELLLAMFEESMRNATGQFLDISTEDPVERLRSIVTTPILMEMDKRAERLTRWRGRERQRLLEFFPDAVEAVYEPYRAAIEEAIVAVCDAGRGTCEAPDVDATVILHLVQEMAHGVHGVGIDSSPVLVAERVWHMVRAGLAVDPASSRAPRRAPRPGPRPAPQRSRR